MKVSKKTIAEHIAYTKNVISDLTESLSNVVSKITKMELQSHRKSQEYINLIQREYYLEEEIMYQENLIHQGGITC